jgi:soluble lytic murein transglycosylase-like protein
MRRTGTGRAAAGAFAVLLACHVPAQADVLEIGPDGSVTVRSGTAPVPRNAEADGREGGDDGQAAEDLAAPARPVPALYTQAVDRIAQRYDLSPALLEALVWQESRWQPRAVSPAGAIGLTQLMPATARALRVDPHDPVANLEGGARFLRAQLDLFDGDIEKALAAYNAGPARVLRAGGVPAIAETRAYVAAIVGRLSYSAKGD